MREFLFANNKTTLGIFFFSCAILAASIVSTFNVFFDQTVTILLWVCFIYLLSPTSEGLFSSYSTGQKGLLNGSIAGAMAAMVGGLRYITAQDPVDFPNRVILITCFAVLIGASFGQFVQIYRHSGAAGRIDRVGVFGSWHDNKMIGIFFVLIIVSLGGLLFWWKFMSRNLFFTIEILSKPGYPDRAIQYPDIVLVTSWFLVFIVIINSFQRKNLILFKFVNYSLMPTMLSIGMLVSLLMLYLIYVFRKEPLKLVIKSGEGIFFAGTLAGSLIAALFCIASFESWLKKQLKSELERSILMEENTMTANQFKGRIDVAIFSVTSEEQAAMHKQLTSNGENFRFYQIDELYYNIHKIKTAFNEERHNEERQILHIRIPNQGNSSAAKVISRIDSIFKPQLVFLVGIAGGMADESFSLGDVLVSTRIVGLGQVKREPGGHISISPDGGPAALKVQHYITSLPVNPALVGWQENIKMQRPQVNPEKDVVYETVDEKLRDTIKDSVEKNLIARHSPIFCEAIIASDSSLVRDPEYAARWRAANRKISHIDMESVGLFDALHDVCPFLLIRSISDIVGIERKPLSAWTQYACESSAAFAYTLIKKDPFLPKI